MGDLSIFVLSNDLNFKDYLCNYLLMDGHYVDSTNQLSIARQMLQRIHYDLILLSLSDCKQEAGLLSEEEIQEINPESEVIFLLNTNNEVNNKILSEKKGGNYLIKTFILDDLPSVLKSVAQRKLLRENTSEKALRDNKRFKERRKSFRIKMDIPIKYTFISPLGNIPSEENITKIINISQDGIMFKVDCKVKFMENVYLNILLPTCGTPINIVGEIIWDNFTSSEPWHYIGLKFSNLNKENKRDLESFIASKME